MPVLKRWTEKEIDIIRKHASTETHREIAMRLPGRTEQAVQRVASIHKIKRAGNPGQFGNKEPWNKGRKCPGVGFAKGAVPPNAAFDGSISLRTDHKHPVKYIRLSPCEWVPLHYHLYEAKHGKLPAGNILVCKSADYLNTDPSNWESISRSEHLRRNRAPKIADGTVSKSLKRHHALKRNPPQLSHLTQAFQSIQSANPGKVRLRIPERRIDVWVHPDKVEETKRKYTQNLLV